SVIPDADGQPIPHIASFGQNFHFGESSSTVNLLTRNSKIVLTGPVCPNLGTVCKRLRKMEKFMSERIDTEGRIKKKFKEQDHHFLGLGCDNIETNRTVRNVMSDFSGLKKLVKDLSDRFEEYERSKVFDAKRVLEMELVNERNAKEFYREFDEYMCRMLQNHQKSKGSFPLPLGSQVREPPVEPTARPVPASHPDDPYVVTRDAAIADAAIATFSIDDDDDTAPMHSEPHETIPPRKSTRGNPPPPLTQDTVNRMIQASVEAAIRAERERVQNEANRAEGPNVAPVARECTFADFMKCSPITFRGNEGAVGGHSGNRSRDQENVGRNEGGSSSGGGNNNSNWNNNYNSNRNYNNNRNNNQNQYRNLNRNHQNNQRQGNARAMTNVENQNINDAGQNVKCNRCGMQHYGNCPIKCNKCGKIGHKARDFWSKVVATGANA
nr:hypothetical protein [Tanacetum cinerariifolium]